jgi:hypothetical protein
MQRGIAVLAAAAAIVIIVLVIATSWKRGDQTANGTPPPHAINQNQ